MSNRKIAPCEWLRTCVRFANRKIPPPWVSGWCVRTVLAVAPHPSAVCDSCVDTGFALSPGLRAPGSPALAPVWRNACCALDSAKHREAAIKDCKSRCDPMLVRKDISLAHPREVELRRASPIELRSAPQRAKRHLAPANTSGLEDVLGQGGDGPSDGTSLVLMTAQFSGPGTRAGKVAMESVGRIRLGRAPHMKYRYLLPNGVQSLDKAHKYSRRAAKQTDSSLVRAVASERVFICEAMRILFTPYAPAGKGLSPPAIRPEGLSNTLEVIRIFSA